MAGGKMTLNVNVIESREHQSSTDFLLVPSLVPARNGYRVTGELSRITDLPNGFLEKSCWVELLQRKILCRPGNISLTLSPTGARKARTISGVILSDRLGRDPSQR